jgi:hypothetical protein
MKTQLSHPGSDGASLRPRIIDVSEDRYATVTELVGPGDTAHFERKGGETTLVIR